MINIKYILSAALRVIKPGLYLRNALETTEKLTLNRLMKLLQPHFKGKSSTDLY